ncbi:hypothetical protein EV363DRAFT_1403610 [Boletus edulis]|nr:hypothetical protein EV363DRAFT_1403610 [Boletus edulis]
MFKPHLLFFVVSLFWTLVCADYTIDDSNYSVLKFSENPAGPVWGPFGSDTGEVLEIRLPNGTMQTVDATQCYDGTYTYAACAAKDNCAMQFSFTGSGITIYVLRAGPQGMSASLSIDSGSATTATLDAPPPPQDYIPHAVLFNVQNIPSGTHTAVMTVQDWNGGFSGMMLDYINVNQAQVSGPTSPSPIPIPSSTPSSTPAQSPSSTPASSNAQTTSQPTSATGTQTNSVAPVSSAGVLSVFSSGTAALPSSTQSGNGTGTADSASSNSKKTNLAVVVGAVIGGVVGLLAILGLIFFCLRRRGRQHMETLNLFPSLQAEARFTDTGVISADPFASSVTLSASQPSGASRPLQSWTDLETGSTSNLANNPRSATIRGPSSGSNSVTSSAPVLVGVAAAVASAALPQDQDASAPTPPGQLAVRPGGGDSSRTRPPTPTCLARVQTQC